MNSWYSSPLKNPSKVDEIQPGRGYYFRPYKDEKLYLVWCELGQIS
jgi:hypothetical protein